MLDEDRDINPYLQQEVLAASPIRLRWMLITRAKELCEGVETLWNDGQTKFGDQWALRIREILGELLAGVADGNPASQKVADFYTFLLAKLTSVQQSHDIETLRTLRELLAYEADTWQLLINKSLSNSATESIETPAAPAAKSTYAPPLHSHLPAPISTSYDDSSDFSSGSSFSIDM